MNDSKILFIYFFSKYICYCLGAGLGSSVGPQLLSTANHLEIPSSNPNLLSPDILNQRRGGCPEPERKRKNNQNQIEYKALNN